MLLAASIIASIDSILECVEGFILPTPTVNGMPCVVSAAQRRLYDETGQVQKSAGEAFVEGFAGGALQHCSIGFRAFGYSYVMHSCSQAMLERRHAADCCWMSSIY
jgi:hypothetical protein